MVDDDEVFIVCCVSADVDAVVFFVYSEDALAFKLKSTLFIDAVFVQIVCLFDALSFIYIFYDDI